jgi:hypothetical protein
MEDRISDKSVESFVIEKFNHLDVILAELLSGQKQVLTDLSSLTQVVSSLNSEVATLKSETPCSNPRLRHFSPSRSQ